jgi:thimet oligopeptidase
MDTTELMKDLQARYTPFGYVEDTHMQGSFGHLYGYSAMYYTYMWSLVIAKDLLSRFEKEGMMSTECAAQYRKHILEPGGSRDAVDLVRAFLGRDYSFDAFTRWVNAR